jgi:hypothetical protein
MNDSIVDGVLAPNRGESIEADDEADDEADGGMMITTTF